MESLSLKSSHKIYSKLKLLNQPSEAVRLFEMNAIGKVEGEKWKKLANSLIIWMLNVPELKPERRKRKVIKCMALQFGEFSAHFTTKKNILSQNVLTYLRQGIIFWLIYLSFACKTNIVNFWRVKYQQVKVLYFLHIYRNLDWWWCKIHIFESCLTPFEGSIIVLSSWCKIKKLTRA